MYVHVVAGKVYSTIVFKPSEAYPEAYPRSIPPKHTPEAYPIGKHPGPGTLKKYEPI